MTKELTNLNIYYNSDKCRIYYTEGNIWSDTKFLLNLVNTDYIFYQFTWNIEEIINSFPWDYDKNLKNNDNFDMKTNIIFCAPTEKICGIIKGKGYRSILLNHNCLIDYNKYTLKIKNESERQYNAVINSRPFWWKRVYLASEVDKLLYIKGGDWAQDETSWNGYKDMNLSLLEDVSPEIVINSYNNSKVGLILSGNTGENQQGLFEGANYSSSEYLLCGLPVVSTKSQGGRDYWFDDYNSIICDPNEKSVKKSVDIMLKKLDNGEINREKIRSRQIEKMDKMRENFINETKEIFNKYNLNVDAKLFFKDNYFHKIINYNKNTFKMIYNKNHKLNFLCYNYKYSNNIGDWVQSLAASQYFPYINKLVERDNFEEYDEILKEENNVLITNGWFWGESKLDYLNNINITIPLAIHFNKCGFEDKKITYTDIHSKNFINNNKKILNNIGETIFTRDQQTEGLFYYNEIKTKTSHCLTLTLKRSVKLPKEDFVIIDERVYLNNDVSTFISNLGYKIIKLDIENKKLTNFCFKENIEHAKYNLDLICKARFVITTRLHLVLPSISLGTKVIYCAHKDSRHQGYEKLINYWLNSSNDVNIDILNELLENDNFYNKETLMDIRSNFYRVIRMYYQINNLICYDKVVINRK